jgi:UDP-N-acetylmuramoyl-tripeptide--D-alanyl-D-alanine ligase
MDIEHIHKLFLSHPAVSTDSRNIIRDSFFFALKGVVYDGNVFAHEALVKGCAYAVVDDPRVAADGRYILVGDVLQTFQDLAALHRSQFDIPVLAITGSNGKTTTKELCHRVLATTYNTVATAGNLNNHIGVPQTLLSITGNTEVAIIEMGANHPGEIGFLCDMARPDLGLITNIGKAHLEGFGSFEGVVHAKKELYEFVAGHGGMVFVNAGNQLLMDLSAGMKKLTYGTGPGPSVRGEVDNNGVFLRVKLYLTLADTRTIREYDLKTHLTGDYNLENVLAAVSVGLHFKISPDRIISAIRNYIPSNMRSEVRDTSSNRLILDAYNANPTSMEMAIRNFARLPGENKWIILGDMRELGDESLSEHQRILDLVRQLSFTRVILIGDQFCQLSGQGEFNFFSGTEEVFSWLKKNPIGHSTVLIKGSRLMKLEKLVELM